MNQRTFSPALTMQLAGKQLLEASAGTGKTFAIMLLYVRLILEQSCTVPEILTVTFTTAAVSELKERIRQELELLLRLLENPAEKPEPAEAELLRRIQHDPDGARRRIRNALRDFDCASISTIHGFCAQMLGDFAFENGRFFQQDQTPSARKRDQEIVRDWIRRRFYHRTGIASLLVQSHDEAEICDQISKILAHPDAEMRPAFPHFNPEEKLEQHLGLLAAMWKSARGEAGEILLQNKTLSTDQQKGLPENRILQGIAAWDAWAEGIALQNLPEAVRHFSSEFHSKIVKKGKTPPQHIFFEECSTAQRLIQQTYHRLLLECADFVRQETVNRREYSGETSFDDLLTDFNSALDRPGTIPAVRSNFRAALIDEFQDTDPIQYAIFKKLFDFEDFPLFLVGDPKQAIYSFRGADFATYCRAAEETPRKISLDTNFRSERAIVSAVNEIFVDKKVSFGGGGITCQPVKASGKPEEKGDIFLEDGTPDPAPFKILFPDAELQRKLANKTNTQYFTIRLLASRIADLLQNPAFTLRGKAPQPSDLAVLVTSNHFGECLRAHLNSCGIPAVTRQNPSVLISEEQNMILDLAHALLEPGNRMVLRRALAWDCFRIPLADFLTEDAIHPWQKLFQDAAQLWRSTGFIAAFHLLCAAGNFAEHLTGVSGGERRWCNLEQLAELIQSRCRKMPPDLRVVQRLLDPDKEYFTEEELQSRLVNDLDAVNIVTIHKSKGLQFPIVLLPMPGRKNGNTETPCLYHCGNREILDFDPDANARLDAQQEDNEELNRLIYVALTRAVNRCEVITLPDSVWPDDFFKAEDGARSAVMRIPIAQIPENPVVRLHQEQTIQMPPEMPQFSLAWVSHSFSSLVNSAVPIVSHTDQPGDYDADSAADPEENNAPDRDPILELPAGAGMGECVHHIFEMTGFQDTPDQIRLRCDAALQNYHLQTEDPERLNALCSMVQNVLHAPLLPDLQLCGIPRQDTLRECRFLYPVENKLDPEKLHRILETYHTPEHPYLPESMPERPIAAGDLINGAIDLIFRRDGVFYLADWKSNSLERKWRNFRPQGVAAEMRKHAYPLQYLLYLTAMRRHWRRTMPGFDYQRHFGGVFYLFVRGIREGLTDSGIYRDIIPPEELLRELEEVLGL